MHEKTACDLDQVWEMVGNDPDSFHEVLEIFRSGLPESMHQIYEFSGQGDAESLARAAHSMKGFATTLSAASATDLALRLEDAAKAGNWELVSDLVADLTREVDAILRLLNRIKQGTAHGQCPDR